MFDTLLCSSAIIITFSSIGTALEGYVVGGSASSIRDVPHVAMLKITIGGASESYMCGSSILNERFLITAAHCVEFFDKPKAEIVAKVGSSDRKRGLLHDALNVFVHPEFNTEELWNDIAILMLKNKLRFSENVKRIAIAPYLTPVETAVIAGWGQYYEAIAAKDSRLRHLTVKVYDRKQCQEIYDHFLSRGLMCAGDFQSENYTAPGDSGSGLVAKNYMLLGVLSYKEPAVSLSLSLYSDVVYYYNWIVKTMLSCQ